MRKTELFTVDGQPMLVPDGDLSMQEEAVVSSDSGYDESGVYHRFGVREGVKSWDFSYSHLTQEEYTYMEELFAGKDTFFFGFRSVQGVWLEVTAYRSERRILYHNAADGQFRNYQFRITEC